MNQFESYSRCLTWIMALLLSVLVAGCGGGRQPVLGVGGIAVRAPTVIAVTPVNNATGVAGNPSITATFSEPMAPIVGGASFTVTCAAPCTNPTGTVALDATNTIATYTLTPGTALQGQTLYTGTITGARSLATGLPMDSPFVWTFTTQAPPNVTAVAPVNKATGVPANTKIITAAFSKAMDPATLTPASFTLECPAGVPVLGGAVTYASAGNVATLTLPAAPDLPPNTTCAATVTTGARDTAGIALASNFVWTFTTGATPDTTRPRVTVTQPATTSPGPTPGVAPNAAISATFTEDMAPATINGGSFTLTCAAPCASPAGSVSYAVGSRTATFTPSAALLTSTTYTATIIGTGASPATDLAGNALAGNKAALPAPSDYVWTFTTAAAPSPPASTSVISTKPDAGASGVCPNATVNATFSVPSGSRMDPATVNAGTFTVTGPATAPASVTPSSVVLDGTGRIATFTPLNPLSVGSYTATIKGGANGVKDQAIPANTMASDFPWTFTVAAATGKCQGPVALGAAAPFGAFGGSSTVTNDGLNTVINGDLGVQAASTKVTGFRDSGGNVYTITPSNNGLVTGLVYTLTAPPGSVAGAAVTKAHDDALVAFNSISPANLPGGIDVSSLAQCPSCGGGAPADSGQLGGRTLPPGVYLSATAAGNYSIGALGDPAGNLTLDAGGDANAVWVFQTKAGTGKLTVGLTGPATPAVPIQVLLINGAQPKNVFWYIPAGATIGTGSTMVGTMLADASITMSTTGGGPPPNAVTTTVNGRAIALTAGVTMTNTVINVPAP
jgi:hypothetical protein